MMALGAHQPQRTADGFQHPRSEEELAALIRFAGRQARQLRVRGSAHSVKGAVCADSGSGNIDIMLDQYAGVVFDDERCRVTVQAGCHLGLDPRDPTHTSTWANSLLAQLDARGWALPDLGGVTHQTVSGFLMTGSCGGTTQYAIEDAVIALRLIDAKGEVHEFQKDRDELFEAASCSMGLLGVISTVTFQCQPRYDVIGREDITSESQTPYALFGDGAKGLEGLLRRSEYARLMWWPQEGVRRVVTWQARRMQDADYGALTGARGALTPKAYSALGDAVRDQRLSLIANRAAQAVGGLFYDSLALAARANALLPTSVVQGSQVRTGFVKHVLPRVLRSFVPTGTTQHFWDSWCHGLPLDNQMSERSLPTDFTEIWLPLERTGDVMRALRAHYDRGGYDATGAFICEVYAARRTRAWLHPAHQRDSLRIDLFWFRRNPGDARIYFERFWKLLQPFGYRLHWGKILPADPALGAHYLRRQYPRWDDFLAGRARLDPDGVFLTRYWRAALGVLAC